MQSVCLIPLTSRVADTLETLFRTQNIYHGGLQIRYALQDEAASVRQAAVDLLGSHIGTRKDLALAYFDTLVTASRDTSTSVSHGACES